ncbi:zinc finger, MYND-type containing 12 family protein, partial [Cardiosporidium cionae]
MNCTRHLRKMVQTLFRCCSQMKMLCSKQHLLATYNATQNAIATCNRLAERHLLGRKFDLAIAASKRALKLLVGKTISVGSIDLAFLHLAEAYLGLGLIDLTKEYLQKASAKITEEKRGDYNVIAKMQRISGRMLHFQNCFVPATQMYAKTLYLLSSIYGPEHAILAPDYFLLGCSLHASLQTRADSIYIFNKVLNLYKAYFGSKTTQHEAMYKSCDFPPLQLNSFEIESAKITIINLLQLIENSKETLGTLE